jgi:hypothetical protein
VRRARPSVASHSLDRSHVACTIRVRGARGCSRRTEAA